MVTWDGAPLIAVEWRDESAAPQSGNEAPEAIAAAIRQGWELAQRQQLPLTVALLRPASTPPQSSDEIDRASEAAWAQMDRWLEAAVPGITARAVVRTGDPLAEIVDELRQSDEPACLLVPASSSQLIASARSIVEQTSAPVWFRPQPADMPIFLFPCPAGSDLAPVLSAAVPLTRDLSGRLLLGSAIAPDASDADREQRTGEIARTLYQFDYRTIAGGVKIEVVAGDAAALVRELRTREAVQTVAWPDVAELPAPWSELGDGSVWFARRDGVLV